MLSPSFRSYSTEHLNLFDHTRTPQQQYSPFNATGLGSRSQPKSPFSEASRTPSTRARYGSSSALKSLSLGTNAHFSAATTPNTPGRTVKEFDEGFRELRKENFNLKLRIYFLEERLGTARKNSNNAGGGNVEDGEEKDREIVDLRMQIESLKYDVQEKLELLQEAGAALDQLEHKLEEVNLEKEALEERLLTQNNNNGNNVTGNVVSDDSSDQLSVLEEREAEVLVEELQKRVHDLQQDLQAERGKRLEIEEEREQRFKDMMALESELVNRDIQLTSIKDDLQLSKHELQDTCARHSNEIETLARDKDKAIATLSSQVKHLKDKMQSRKEELKSTRLSSSPQQEQYGNKSNATLISTAVQTTDISLPQIVVPAECTASDAPDFSSPSPLYNSTTRVVAPTPRSQTSFGMSNIDPKEDDSLTKLKENQRQSQEERKILLQRIGSLNQRLGGRANTTEMGVQCDLIHDDSSATESIMALQSHLDKVIKHLESSEFYAEPSLQALEETRRVLSSLVDLSDPNRGDHHSSISSLPDRNVPEFALASRAPDRRLHSDEDDSSWSEPDVNAARKRMGLVPQQRMPQSSSPKIDDGNKKAVASFYALEYTHDDEGNDDDDDESVAAALNLLWTHFDRQEDGSKHYPVCSVSGSLECLSSSLYSLSVGLSNLDDELNISDSFDSGFSEDDNNDHTLSVLTPSTTFHLCSQCQSKASINIEKQLQRTAALLPYATATLQRLRSLCGRLRERIAVAIEEGRQKDETILHLERKCDTANTALKNQMQDARLEVSKRGREIREWQAKLKDNFKLVSELSQDNLKLRSELLKMQQQQGLPRVTRSATWNREPNDETATLSSRGSSGTSTVTLVTNKGASRITNVSNTGDAIKIRTNVPKRVSLTSAYHMAKAGGGSSPDLGYYDNVAQTDSNNATTVNGSRLSGSRQQRKQMEAENRHLREERDLLMDKLVQSRGALKDTLSKYSSQSRPAMSADVLRKYMSHNKRQDDSSSNRGIESRSVTSQELMDLTKL